MPNLAVGFFCMMTFSSFSSHWHWHSDSVMCPVLWHLWVSQIKTREWEVCKPGPKPLWRLKITPDNTPNVVNSQKQMSSNLVQYSYLLCIPDSRLECVPLLSKQANLASLLSFTYISSRNSFRHWRHEPRPRHIMMGGCFLTYIWRKSKFSETTVYIF